MIKIVYFEDEESIAALAEKKLQKAGYKVLLRVNGVNGFEFVKEEQPDLILLDIMMPVVDGFSVLAAIKEDEETASIPIIILSALGDKSDVIKGIELGADDYLLKPFHPKTMLQRVEQALRSAGKLV
ncbi:MAG: response regulator [SAR324 cluster bacterium]|nr:response regulator [SAR324 cluster bacterium]